MIISNQRLVLARAKRNFSNGGCGNRMWNANSDSTGTFKLNQALFLTDEEREKFIMQAKEELSCEAKGKIG